MPDPYSARPNWAARLQTAFETARGQDLDALIVSTPANIRYLTGFTGSTALLVCGGGDHTLITDGRYGAAVREGLADGSLAPVCLAQVENRYDLTLAGDLGSRQTSRVGFEAAHVTVATLARWKASAPGVEWRSTEDVVEHQRLVKDATELAILRRAGGLLSDVARNLGSFVLANRTERQVAADIDAALLRAGFTAPAFPTIVAAGPNSAHPHARPTDRHLRDGDLVVLDFGGVLDGYCVDLTRMAAIGQVTEKAAGLFAAVRDAQVSAIEAVREGARASDVDRAARELLDTRGFGPAFLHGTGHGLGLDVHEAPRLGRAESGATQVLRAGMVCTIEPGAYIAGLGGVRLEDDVIVTTGGCDVITNAPRDLLLV